MSEYGREPLGWEVLCWLLDRFDWFFDHVAPWLLIIAALCLVAFGFHRAFLG